MAAVDRNQPKRAASSESRMSLSEFMQEFPDDATCLEHLWRQRYSPDGEHALCPKCEKVRVFKKYPMANRNTSWTCTGCGQHVHPLAGTIFHKSSTSLHLWFYAMYLMSSTRCGISAKQLERELGVNYKTAWRMMNLIRNQLMTQDDTPLSGDVEADETFVGGKPRATDHRSLPEIYAAKKSTVFAAVERQGRIRAEVVPNSGARTLSGAVRRFVLPASTLFTDEYAGYVKVGRDYQAHHRIRHKQAVYVRGNVHTQTIEGFFSTLKNGIRGAYHSVSKKWLQSYLDEYVFRYNHRTGADPFRVLLLRAAPPA